MRKSSLVFLFVCGALTLTGCEPAKGMVMTARMFAPMCDTVMQIGTDVTTRAFYIGLLKDTTVNDMGGGGMQPDGGLPGIPKGYVEVLCKDTMEGKDPASPRASEQLYTWQLDPMMTQTGQPFTLGMFSSHQSTEFKWHVEGQDLIVDQLTMTGLVPGGVYTLWFSDVSFALANGQNPTKAAKPWGKADGSESVANAGADGTITVVKRKLIGAGRYPGPKGFSIDLHLDGKSYGPLPNPNAFGDATDPTNLTGISDIPVLWAIVTLRSSR